MRVLPLFKDMDVHEFNGVEVLVRVAVCLSSHVVLVSDG